MPIYFLMVCVPTLFVLAWLLPPPPQAAASAPPGDQVEDFEARERLDVVYDDWTAVVEPPEYPAYNQISLVDDPASARSGRRFIRFRMYGHNAAFRMTPRAAWRIEDPTRSFLFGGWIRLDGSRRNKAFCTVEWKDRGFRTLREDHSPAVDTSGDWTPFTLDVPAVPPETSWAVVRLNCGGPDVRGTCDFDRLRLSSRPRILFERTMPTLAGRTTPRFRVTASGFPGDAHTLEAVSRDLWGRPAGRFGPIPIAAGRPVLVGLPPHPPGFYEVTLSLAGSRGRVERRTWPLAIPNERVFSDEGKSWIGGTFNPWATSYPDATALARLAGFTDARVVLWDRSGVGRADTPNESEILSLVQEVSRISQMSVTGVLASPPASLFPGLDPGLLDRNPRSLFQLNRPIWEKPFRDTVLKYWELVPRWELRGEGDAPEAVGILNSVSSRATVAGEAPAELDLPALPASGPEGIREQVTELLRALIEQHAQGGDTEPIFAPLESSAPGTLLDRDGYPRAPLFALRAINDLLPEATPRPDLRLDDPRLRDFVFQKDGRLIIAVWSVDGVVETVFNLGGNIRLYPPLGAVTLVGEEDRIRLGPMPVFLLDADPFFLQVQQSVHFYDPASPANLTTDLPLQVNASPRGIRFRNLFRNETITNVRLRILEVPHPWVIRPREFRTDSLRGGEEFSAALTFVLPPTQREESREIPLELTFNRGATPYNVRISRTLRVAPKIDILTAVDSVEGDASARRVSVTIRNNADRPATLSARIRLPGIPEQVVVLGRIESKAIASRRLRFIVRDLDRIPADRRVGEILCEERGGSRLHARVRIILR